MAIKLIGNYAKRLGLPGYSSHQFSVSCETELTDLSQVPDEVARLYGLLQESVDQEIQDTGFVPGHDYGEVPPTHRINPSNGSDHNGNAHHPAPRPWQCSDKQRELIAELAGELHLDDEAIDQRARRLFQRPASQLNKLAASGLISDLLAEAGTRRHQSSNGHPNGNGNGNGNGTRPHRTPRLPAANGRKGGAA
jgi:hypothetical protein